MSGIDNNEPPAEIEKRGPGRPRKEPTPTHRAEDLPIEGGEVHIKFRDAHGAPPDQETDPAGYDAYVAHLMARRKPFGAFLQKLARPERPGYYRYWFSDEPGRIKLAQDAGYTFVKTADGKNETFVVDPRHPGGPMLGYLMEIPLALWEADQRQTHRRTDEIESAIKKSKVHVANPQEASEDQGGFYVPKSGSKVESGLARGRK